MTFYIRRSRDTYINYYELNSQGMTNVTDTAVADMQNQSNQKPIASGSHNYHEGMDVDENRRVSLNDLPIFCDQLERFIKYIQNVQDLQFIISNYPQYVKKTLKKI